MSKRFAFILVLCALWAHAIQASKLQAQTPLSQKLPSQKLSSQKLSSQKLQESPSLLPTPRKQRSYGLDPTKSLTQYAVHSWDTEDGLPSLTITSLAQTPDGFLWLATFSGLARFDGVRFSVFDYRSTPQLRSNTLNSLLADSAGNLWIGGEGCGLVRLRNRAFTAYSAERHGLASDIVYSLASGARDTLWIATSKGLQAARYTPEGDSVQILPVAYFPGETALKVFRAADSTLWIIVRNKGVFLLKNGVVRRFEPAKPIASPPLPPTTVITDFAQTPDGVLWMSTLDRGLLSYNGAETELFHLNGAQPIQGSSFSLFADRVSGAVWLSSTKSLYRIYNGRISELSTNKNLINARIFQDREGNLWFGSYRDGLSRMQNGKFLLYGELEGLTDEATHCVAEDAQGRLWIGGDNGLSVIEKNAVKTFTVQSGDLPNNTVRDVCPAPDGNVWIATGWGLARFDGKRFVRFSPQTPLSNERLRRLCLAKNGTLWIASESGLNAISPQPSTENRSGRLEAQTAVVQKFMEKEFIHVVAEDAGGVIWVGTNGGGLYSIRGGFPKREQGRFGLSNKVFDICPDADGALWLAVDNGICRFKNGVLTAFSEDNGFMTILNPGPLTDDGGGWLWTLSGGYLLQISKDDLNEIANRQEAGRADFPRAQMRRYGKSDGLRSSNRSSNSKNCMASDGTLWVSTSRGAAALRLDNIPQNPFTPTVVVESVALDDSLVAAAHFFSSGALNVEGEVKRCSFYLAVPSFTAPEKVRISARLEGFDDKAFEIGYGQRKIEYANLKRGRTYILRVKASNNDDVWNENETTLSLYFAPFFWETPWFFGLCLASILVAGYGGLQWRVRYMRAQALVLQKMVKERTKELEDANEEILRQSFIHAEQAQQIELANSELHEQNIQLEHLNAAFGQKVKELETIDDIVQTINNELDFEKLLAALLEKGHILVPNAEKSSILVYDEASDLYRFIAFHGYDASLFLHLRFSREDIEYRYLRNKPLHEGVYIITEYPSLPEINSAEMARAEELELTPKLEFTTEPPKCSLAMTISFNDVVEGIIFFDNYLSAEAFTATDVERFRRFRKHVVTAFAKAKIMTAMHDSARRLSEQNYRLQELDKEKNEFLGIAAHDMKSPLAGIMMSVGLLRRYYDKMSKEDRLKIFDSIEHVARRMTEIISNFLDINAIESGAIKLSPARFDILALAKQTLEQYEDRANAKDIAIHFVHESGDKAVYVFADLGATAQTLDNLISNAIKYSPLGKNIVVRCRAQEKTTRIEVEDEGAGLTPEDMKKLFGKFARLSARPTAGEDSAGLGLSIVKRLVESMNGKVWCESEYGRGSTFIVELPSA